MFVDNVLATMVPARRIHSPEFPAACHTGFHFSVGGTPGSTWRREETISYGHGGDAMANLIPRPPSRLVLKSLKPRGDCADGAKTICHFPRPQC